MKKLVILMLLFLVLGCTQNKNAEQEIGDTPEIASSELQIQKQIKVELLPEAQEEISQWMAYNNLNRSIEEMEQYDLKELRAKIETLVETVAEFQATMPTNFKVPPVQARTNVLFTKTMVLDQQLNMQKPDLNRINELGSEITSEFEFLKIQLNELFLQSPSSFIFDMEEEMLSRQDSLRSEVDSNGIVPTNPVFQDMIEE